MPESSCLHIQDSASGPIRVLEIPWPLVRVGRASFCEVRLNVHDLAPEVCRLLRRGNNWQIEPLVANTIRLDDRSVNGIRLLPFDSTIEIGEYRLTLRASKLAAPNWGNYQTPRPTSPVLDVEPRFENPVANTFRENDVPASAQPIITAEPDPIGQPVTVRPATYEAPSSRIERGTVVPQSSSLLRDRQRWENRWRAAGEKLGAATSPKTSRDDVAFRTPKLSDPDLQPHVPEFKPQAFRLAPVPLKEVAVPPSPSLRSVPSIDRVADWSRPASREETYPESRVSKPEEVLSRVTEPQSPVEPFIGGEEIAPDIDNEPGLENDVSSFFIEAIPSDTLFDASESAELDTAEEASGESSKLIAPTASESELLTVEELSSSPYPEIEAEHESVESSVDDRISSWNPSWFDRPDATEALDESKSHSSPPALDVSFNSETAIVAPAECLDTVTTSLGGRIESGLDDGFSVSTDSSPPESPRNPVTAPSNRTEARQSPTKNISSPEPPRVSSARLATRTETGSSHDSHPRESQVTAARSRESIADRSSRSVPSAYSGENKGVVARGPAEREPKSVSDDWPSVDDIMAAHRRASAGPVESVARTEAKPVTRKQASGPALADPSLAVEPEYWELPLWFGWPPLASAMLLLGVLGCAMSWTWMQDARNASIVVNRLLGNEAEILNGRPIPLPDWAVMPNPSWYRSTPRHLTNWAAYLGRSIDANERGEEIRALLAGAKAASPVYAPARLAQARLEDAVRQIKGESSAQELGLSRDPIALSWTAQRFLKAGRKDVALPLYRKALELTARPEFSPETAPRFAEDARVKRYLLPGEDLVNQILGGLVADPNLKFSDLSSVLPEGSVATLVAVRLLKDQNSRDSDALLDQIVSFDEHGDDEDPVSAVRHAVRAEAFAMKAKWKDAEREYYAAIDRIDHEATHRSWWYNLAEIEHRLNNDTQRQEAIKKALASTVTTDEIARRAADLRRGQPDATSEGTTRLRGPGLKAN